MIPRIASGTPHGSAYGRVRPSPTNSSCHSVTDAMLLQMRQVQFSGNGDGGNEYPGQIRSRGSRSSMPSSFQGGHDGVADRRPGRGSNEPFVQVDARACSPSWANPPPELSPYQVRHRRMRRNPQVQVLAHPVQHGGNNAHGDASGYRLERRQLVPQHRPRLGKDSAAQDSSRPSSAVSSRTCTVRAKPSAVASRQGCKLPLASRPSPDVDCRAAVCNCGHAASDRSHSAKRSLHRLLRDPLHTPGCTSSSVISREAAGEAGSSAVASGAGEKVGRSKSAQYTKCRYGVATSVLEKQRCRSKQKGCVCSVHQSHHHLIVLCRHRCLVRAVWAASSLAAKATMAACASSTSRSLTGPKRIDVFAATSCRRAQTGIAEEHLTQFFRSAFECQGQLLLVYGSQQHLKRWCDVRRLQDHRR